MRDWRAYVRSKLPPLACSADREPEIVDEIAEQLQDICEGAIREGATDEDGDTRARAEVSDWAALARDLLAAEHPLSAPPRRFASAVVTPAARRTRFGPVLLEIPALARHAIRTLGAQPLFTVTTIATFALGIGATTLVYALVQTVLIAPLPYREPQQLGFIQQVVPEIAERYPIVGVNPRSFIAYQASCRTTCEALSAVASDRATLTGAGEPAGVIGARISPNLFDVLGAELARGRKFEESEATPGRDAVAIITYGLWQGRFGGDSDIVGRRITLNGRPIEVVGVLPSSFRFPQISHSDWTQRVSDAPDYFRPLAWPSSLRESWGEYDNSVFVRLRLGVTVDAMQAELKSITDADFASAPIHPYPVVQPLSDVIVSNVRRPLWLLLGAVAVTLLIACVNVANLMGARWIARQRELALRTALGAGRVRLVTLVAIESVVLASVGGVIGVTGAWLALHSIVARLPVNIPRLDDTRLDPASLVVALALTAASGVAAAVLPAWWAARVDPGDTLRDTSHTTTGGRSSATVRAWLVGGEVALTALLLMLGGLLLASFANVLRVDRGFSTTSVVAADVVLSGTRYPDDAARARFLDTLLAALESAPEIAVAGVSQKLPLEGDAAVDSMIPDGDTRPIGEQPIANHLRVSAGYFQTVGIPLVRGRLLSPDDRARPVAVISEQAARTIWPGVDPIGHSFTRSDGRIRFEVVGIVGDARIRGLEREAPLVAYVPYGIGTPERFSVAARSSVTEAAAMARIREVVRGLDAELPLQKMRTFDAVVDEALALRRFQMRLVVGFALAGLALACIGIYGVASSAVQRRRTELAVRVALGASVGQVRRLVMRQGLTPILVGLVVGLALGIAAARVAAAMLFGVAPAQPVVVAIVATIVLAAALAACLEPAIRAARTPIASTLRQ
jgi:putative ABC transport system permease protein